MKKNLFFVILMVSAIVITSCNKHMAVSKIGQTPVTMSEADMKEILGPGYYQDSVIKKLHLFNTADVIWRSENSQTKIFVDFQDGRVQSTKDKTKDMMSGFLPAGTEGQVDSIVRYNTGNIWKLKVKYIIKQTGRAMFIWYYRKDKLDDPDASLLDGPLHWYQSNNSATQSIDGVSLTRTTLDNRLQWMFSLETKQKTNKKGFDVVSPFASTLADGVVNPGKSPPKKVDEEEEKN